MQHEVRVFPVNLHVIAYGMTEATGGISLTEARGESKYGCVGRILAASEAKLVDLETG